MPISFANPAIYARYHTSAYHDVTDQPLGPGVTIAAANASLTPSGTILYDLITFARDTGLRATIGYDDVTGVGSPAPGYLDSYRTPEAARYATAPAEGSERHWVRFGKQT